jgi:ribosomal protection tetracycline resistance protein
LPVSESDSTGTLSGTVFKVDRGPAGERVAYVRMFGGTLRVRDRIQVRAAAVKVTAIRVFGHGTLARQDAVTAGQIAQVLGLGPVRIGDRIGTRPTGRIGDPRGGRHFSPPTLETVVDPVRPSDRAALHAALTRLTEQDPLINLRQDELRKEIAVSLYGEVH